MRFKTKIIIFALLVLVLSISAASAHENIIADGNDTIDNDIISISQFDDGLDDLDDDDWDGDSDDGLDDGLDDLDDDFDDELDDDSDWDDDDDWDVDSDLDDDLDDGDDDSDWEDDDDWDDDWDDDDSDWDDDDDWDDDWYDDWDDDWDYDDSDWYDDCDYDWDGNYTNSSIRYCKLIAYCCDDSFLTYKTTSSREGRACADSGSEDDCENMTCAGSGSEDDCKDECDDDSQEEFSLEDSRSFATACPGASASFEANDELSQNHESVSKSIDQGQNILDNEKENSGNVTDNKDVNDTITFSYDNDLGVFGLLISLLLCIILLI